MVSEIWKLIEGPCAGVSWTQLTALGARTINSIPVPEGMSCLELLDVAFAQGVQTDAKGGLVGIRLSGNAMMHTPYEFLVGGFTNGTKTTSGGHRQVMRPFRKMAGLQVKPENELIVEACVISGSDPGTTEVMVNPKFVPGGGKKRYSIIRYGSEASVDTETAMDLNAESASKTDYPIPKDVKELIGVIPAVGGICLATASGGGSHYRFKSGLKDGPFVIGGPAWSALNTDPGICAGIIESLDIPMHKAVQPAGILEVTAEQNGTDWGTVYLGLSAEFE